MHTHTHTKHTHTHKAKAHPPSQRSVLRPVTLPPTTPRNHKPRRPRYKDREEQYYRILKGQQSAWPGLPDVTIWDYSRCARVCVSVSVCVFVRVCVCLCVCFDVFCVKGGVRGCGCVVGREGGGGLDARVLSEHFVACASPHTRLRARPSARRAPGR